MLTVGLAIIGAWSAAVKPATATTPVFVYWDGPGYPNVASASWAASAPSYTWPWSIGYKPTDDYVYLYDYRKPNLVLSYVQTLGEDFCEAQLQLHAQYMYVLGGAAGSSGTSHTLTLTGNGTGTSDIIILDSAALGSAPSNPTFGKTFYLGYYAAVASTSGAALTTNAVANINLSYSGLKGITTNQSGTAKQTLDMTSNIAGTGGIQKKGAGILVLELPSGPTIRNTFTGGFQLDAGTVLIGRDTDLYNSTPSLRHGALGMGTVTINGGSIGSANGAPHQIENSIVVAGDFITGDSIAGSSGLIFSGSMDLGNQARTLTVINSTTVSGVISGAGGSLIKSGTGTLALSDSNTYSGGTTVNGGTLVADTPDALGANAPLAINGSETVVQVLGQGQLVEVASLALAQGTLDLQSNDLLWHSTSANLSTDLAALTAWLGAGFNGGSWDGTGGIASSTADLDGNCGFGFLTGADFLALYGSTATFDNHAVLPTDILLKYTWAGDTNLDGHVNALDYLLMDRGYLKGLSGWRNGDLNYDGVVNYQDYARIDRAFTAQTGSGGQIPWQSGVGSLWPAGGGSESGDSGTNGESGGDSSDQQNTGTDNPLSYHGGVQLDKIAVVYLPPGGWDELEGLTNDDVTTPDLANALTTNPWWEGNPSYDPITDSSTSQFAAAAPEPATLGVLALGGLTLLTRRKKQ